MLKAVARDGNRLRNVSEELKRDRDIVLTAVTNCLDSWALRYASDELKQDREFMLKAVARSGQALEYASEELKRDLEIVLTAVKQILVHYGMHQKNSITIENLC